VCAHYVHLAGTRGRLLGKLAAAAVPGGTLLNAEHARHCAADDPSVPAARVTAAELAAALDPAQWDVTVTEPPVRQVNGHALHDVILRARKRP
jgi:hypothetical protein